MVEITWELADAIRAALAGEVPISCRMVERAAHDLVRAIEAAEAAERKHAAMRAFAEGLARALAQSVTCKHAGM